MSNCCSCHIASASHNLLRMNFYLRQVSFWKSFCFCSYGLIVHLLSFQYQTVEHCGGFLKCWSLEFHLIVLIAPGTSVVPAVQLNLILLILRKNSLYLNPGHYFSHCNTSYSSCFLVLGLTVLMFCNLYIHGVWWTVFVFLLQILAIHIHGIQMLERRIGILSYM